VFAMPTTVPFVPWQLCPPPGSTGSSGSGTGHRKQPAASEPIKKPTPAMQ
jgi:hypothetical protein